MSKKIKVLIIGSLLLNVLLVGVIIGNISDCVLRDCFWGRHAREVGSKLSQDKARLFLDTVEKVHLNNRDMHKQVREARERAMNILTAHEFDEAAYQIEVDKLHELRGLIMRRFADATIELTRQFNQKERRVLAQYLRRPERPPRNVRSPRNAGPPHHHEAP
jgi:uncharacterized membrane protein